MRLRLRSFAESWCDSGVTRHGFFGMLGRMAGVGRIPQTGVVESGPPDLDRAISDLAARQHGVVATRQLVALGITQQAVSRRAAAGRLHRVHRGVFAVGHPVLDRPGRWMAAVLACGPGAALSHAGAAALWDIRGSSARLTDVTTPRTGRSRPGLRIHRPRTLRPDEVTVSDGIPVTTPARTILDLAAVLQRRPLEQVLDRAELHELTDYPALDALAAAHPGHHGAGKLRRALERHAAGTTLTKGKLEERFLKLCRDHRLPTPVVNTWPAGREVDFLFASDRLIVETDSWTHHHTRDAFENDRRRDALHARAGYRTLRFTHRQLTDEPGAVAAAVAAVLADRRAA
jgi:very-short-patch-repair endonuclease